MIYSNLYAADVASQLAHALIKRNDGRSPEEIMKEAFELVDAFFNAAESNEAKQEEKRKQQEILRRKKGLEDGQGNIKYYDENYLLHREDEPAVVGRDGYKAYYCHNKLHNLNGPAVEFPDGTKHYWIDDKRHRLDAPAVEKANGDKEWWVNNRRHNLNGPAITSINTKGEPYSEYYIEGERILQKQYKKAVKEYLTKQNKTEESK